MPEPMSEEELADLEKRLALGFYASGEDVSALLAEVRRLRAKLDAINDARRPFTNALLREQAAETLLLHSDFMNLPRHIRVSVYDDLAKWVGGIIDCVADGGGDHGEG